MRIISFNVNGIKSMTGKLKNGEKKGSPTHNGLVSLLEEQAPDILCLQELKTQNEGEMAWLRTHFPHVHTNLSLHKKGYSGVALLSKDEPEWVTPGFDLYDEDDIGEYHEKGWNMEGRLLTAAYKKFIVVTVYTPNSQAGLARLEERLQWDRVFRMYVMMLEKDYEIPVVICGDLNCSFEDIDIHSPNTHKGAPGFSQEERDEFELLLEAGFVDSFRTLHPDTVGYTYFSNFSRSRERGAGWRLDYVLVSANHRDQIKEATILGDYFGSDHVPVQCTLHC